MKNRSKADGAANESVNVIMLEKQALNGCCQAESSVTKTGHPTKTSTVFFKRPQSPIYVKQFSNGGYEVVELWRHMMSFQAAVLVSILVLSKKKPLYLSQKHNLTGLKSSALQNF